MEASFQYAPLNYSWKRPTRLLRILAWNAQHDCPSLYLREVDLAEHKREYEAVSYRWGEQSIMHLVYINGKPFHIRESIWKFIKHWTTSIGRNGMSDTDLWIDSICINQQNLVEKSRQVRGMGQIYAGARRVIIWLGDASEESAVLDNQISRDRSVTTYGSDAERDSALHFCSKLVNVTRTNGQAEDVLATLRSLSALLHNPYWRRLWVVPEILLAKEAAIVCGHTLCSARYVVEIMLDAQGYGLIPTFDSSDPADTLLRYFVSRQNRGHGTFESKGTLGRLALQFRHHVCSDPLDHLYAIASMVKNGESFPVVYGSPADQVLIQALQFENETATVVELDGCQALEDLLGVNMNDMLLRDTASLLRPGLQDIRSQLKLRWDGYFLRKREGTSYRRCGQDASETACLSRHPAPAFRSATSLWTDRKHKPCLIQWAIPQIVPHPLASVCLLVSRKRLDLAFYEHLEHGKIIHCRALDGIFDAEMSQEILRKHLDLGRRREWDVPCSLKTLLELRQAVRSGIQLCQTCIRSTTGAGC
jgi:hypothetical protein